MMSAYVRCMCKTHLGTLGSYMDIVVSCENFFISQGCKFCLSLCSVLSVGSMWAFNLLSLFLRRKRKNKDLEIQLQALCSKKKVLCI